MASAQSLYRYLLAFAFLVVPFWVPRDASAYSYESVLSTGCHERITMDALRASRATFASATAPPIIPDANDGALVDDLPYHLDDDLLDLGGATLTAGVRDNDLKGRGPVEIDQIAQVHGDPFKQEEHCLRAKDNDEPFGTQQALEACRAFIREKVADALGGLDANGVINPNDRVELVITLELRGSVSASLPRFYVRAGQALHTLQDSFSHTFRSPDHMRVRTTLNWIDWIDQDQIDARDGPVHRSGLDECEDLDAFRAENLQVATRASVDLLGAMLDPVRRTTQERIAAVDTVLAKYMSYEPGCTADNGWCDAPERAYEIEPGCGCTFVGGKNSHTSLAVALAAASLVALRRRRRQLSGLVACILMLRSAEALADGPASFPTKTQHREPATPDSAVAPAEATPSKADPAAPPQSADPPPPKPGPVTKEEVKEEITRQERADSLFRIYAAGSGSASSPSLSGQFGGRIRLSERWLVGLDGELNGWIGVHTGKLRTGAFNAYATVILRYPLRFQAINLRTTGNIGTSTMLIDLYGAPRGTTGLFLGITPLGLEWQISKRFYAIIDALGVALPIPQLTGAPFAYPQYRTALGLELAL